MRRCDIVWCVAPVKAAWIAGWRVNQQIVLWDKKNFRACLLIGVNQYNMNRQLYALRMKLASLTDAKKILALQLKIQQIEQSKKWKSKQSKSETITGSVTHSQPLRLNYWEQYPVAFILWLAGILIPCIAAIIARLIWCIQMRETFPTLSEQMLPIWKHCSSTYLILAPFLFNLSPYNEKLNPKKYL